MQCKYLKKLGLLIASIAGAAFMLSGCSDGKDGAPGKDGKDAAGTTSVASVTPDQWSSIDFAPKGEVLGVTINSPPVVKFKLTDGSGKALTGFSNYSSRAATATVASYPNISFSLAKLVPGANGSPSKWVNYIVTTVPTKTAAVTASKPSTDNTGTLKENSDGTYEYTFYRDITKVKDVVAGLTLTGNNKAADLGDLTYDKNLVHRLTIQVSGNARGTGTNTVDGSNSGVTAVPMANPINMVYDFIPATGKAVAAKDSGREIVDLKNCNECHTKLNALGFHGGSRYDSRYCVVCHTEQRKYGTVEATTTATGFSGSTSRINDFAVGNFPNFIHKIHLGEDLGKTGYNYAGVLFNEVTYPQPVTNCAKCHTKTDVTPQGNNWQTTPNRFTCGACHDGIKWADNSGSTKHVGGSATDDSQCALCHKAADIISYHVTVTPPDNGVLSRVGHNGKAVNVASLLNPPAGLYKIALEIKQVTVAGAAGAKQAKVVYRILKDGQPVTLNATGNLIDNVEGTPSIQVDYAVTIDGIAKPADWTNEFSVTVKDIRDAVAGKGTQTGPDASGYYTATLATVIPDAAEMVTAAIGINYDGFVQMNLPAYPNGVRLRESEFKFKTADGQTARRAIVSNAKCNACHAQLGVFTGKSFHNGARNNGEGCALCHSNSVGTGMYNATGHVGATYSYGGGWSVGIKDLVHAVHGSSKRTVDYTYEASAENPRGFGTVTYPGILKNCEACHVAGSYDFSNSANAAAVPNLLWSTVAKADMTIPADYTGAVLGLSKWMESFVLPKGTPANFTGRAANLVISPIAAACFGCHDDSSAVAHMRGNGGRIYAPAGSATFAATSPEACLTCHGSGKIADIKKSHKF